MPSITAPMLLLARENDRDLPAGRAQVDAADGVRGRDVERRARRCDEVGRGPFDEVALGHVGGSCRGVAFEVEGEQWETTLAYLRARELITGVYIETRLPILFSEGVGKGRITLNEFVALSATNHAKTYGLYPKKGTIAVGTDADIAIWDPDKKVTISQSLLHGGCDYTPYEGIAVTGWPVSTMVRGQFVVRDGALVGKAGSGTYVARDKSPLAKPVGKAAWE